MRFGVLSSLCRSLGGVTAEMVFVGAAAVATSVFVLERACDRV